MSQFEPSECAEDTTKALGPAHSDWGRSSDPQFLTSQARHQRVRSFIPVLNRDTVNPETYDVDYLMSPKSQRIPLDGHRLKQSSYEAGYKYPSRKREELVRSRLEASKSYLRRSLGSDSRCKKPLNVEERFYQYRQATNEKVAQQRKAKEEAELQACTFQPRVNPNPRPRRTSEQYYSEMVKRKQTSTQKIAQHKEAQESSQPTYSHRPTLCSKSIKMVQAKTFLNPTPHERLFTMFKEAFSNEFIESASSTADMQRTGNSPTLSFIPAVNKRSKQLQRAQPIETILYEDALRRRQKAKPERAKPQSPVTKNSTALLTAKLLSDFTEAVTAHDIYKTGVLNYTRFTAVLAHMNFMSNLNSMSAEETELVLILWDMVQRQDQVEVDHLKVAIMGVMGYFEPWMNNCPGFTLTLQKTRSLHDKFLAFSKHRTMPKTAPPLPETPRRVKKPRKSSARTREPPQPKTPQSSIPESPSSLPGSAEPDYASASPRRLERRNTCLSLNDIRAFGGLKTMLEGDVQEPPPIELKKVLSVDCNVRRQNRISSVCGSLTKFGFADHRDESLLSPIIREEDSVVLKHTQDHLLRPDLLQNTSLNYNTSFFAFDDDSIAHEVKAENVHDSKKSV